MIFWMYSFADSGWQLQILYILWSWSLRIFQLMGEGVIFCYSSLSKLIVYSIKFVHFIVKTLWLLWICQVIYLILFLVERMPSAVSFLLFCLELILFLKLFINICPLTYYHTSIRDLRLSTLNLFCCFNLWIIIWSIPIIF